MDTKYKKLLNEDFDEFLKEIGQEHLLSADEEPALIKAVQEKGLECEEADRVRFEDVIGPNSL